MQKNRNNRRRRLKNLIVFCTFCAIVLTVSTYAWFVGLQTVNVSKFDVEIVATDSLMLSLNGSTWSDTVAISKETFNTVSYTGNTNSWGGTGLIPVSTVGAMNDTDSRMILYEKASLTQSGTATGGGYRLLASRIGNHTSDTVTTLPKEQDGYVVFDLFIRNFTGADYIKELDTANEEAIYLTTDSAVTVANDGVAETGIENSVRVAFTQIGRVKGTTTDTDTITGIKCEDVADETSAGLDVTKICRDAQIWEPNDKDHVAAALSYYNTSCRKRTDATTYSTEACTTYNLDDYLQTYAVNSVIEVADKVDIYDGTADGTSYNGYTATTKLTKFDYFTDSEKLLTGTERPQFMTLAPNSITKLRIYIYIEGQDIDNYDFAQIGRKISVQFGFTKQRYTEEDIEYEGPELAIGICSGGDVPTTSQSCAVAYGSWNGTSCEGNTKRYCDNIRGTFRATGTCTGITVPTTEETCTAASGTWADGACSGNTKKYCDALGGTFAASIAPEKVLGTCAEGTVPATTEDCASAYGTWNGTACSGDTKRYCDYIGGTFTPAE